MSNIPERAYTKLTASHHIKPFDISRISSRYKVEQCGEFVHRYFQMNNKHYPTLGQPYFFFLNGLDHNNNPQPAWVRISNNNKTPPKAGDILVAKGKGGGDFHTALITEVSIKGVTVIQANVPYNWNSQPIIEDTFTLQFNSKTQKYYMPDLPTSQHGYTNDFVVIGWIRGTTPNTKL